MEEVTPRQALKNEWKFDPDPGESVSGRDDSMTESKQAGVPTETICILTTFVGTVPSGWNAQQDQDPPAPTSPLIILNQILKSQNGPLQQS